MSHVQYARTAKLVPRLLKPHVVRPRQQRPAQNSPLRDECTAKLLGLHAGRLGMEQIKIPRFVCTCPSGLKGLALARSFGQG